YHVAVVAGEVGRCPDRVENGQIGLGDEAQGFSISGLRSCIMGVTGECRRHRDSEFPTRPGQSTSDRPEQAATPACRAFVGAPKNFSEGRGVHRSPFNRIGTLARPAIPGDEKVLIVVPTADESYRVGSLEVAFGENAGR